MSYKLPLKILALDSDDTSSALWCKILERNGFDVVRLSAAEQLGKVLATETLNLAIISSRSHGISALEVAVQIKKLKKFENLPIIFLLDPDELKANYYALNGNNSDITEILHRPFSSDSILNIVRSLLRRVKPQLQATVLQYKDISINLANYKVFRGGKQIHLGPTEFKMLHLFLKSPKVIFSRQNIIDHVWGADKIVETRTVDVHINRLRNTINTVNDDPLIKTIRSGGYCISLPGEID